MASRPQVEQAYGAPLWVVHRADLQRTLLEHAEHLGAIVHTHARVDRVDFAVSDDPEVFGDERVGAPQLRVRHRGEAEGAWIEADVVIAADGIRSETRRAMMEIHGAEDYGACARVQGSGMLLTAHAAEDTGDAAYREAPGVCPCSRAECWLRHCYSTRQVRGSPRAAQTSRRSRGSTLDGPVSTLSSRAYILLMRYSGGHIMAYPLRNHELYNMVLLHPARAGVKESWTATGPRSVMDEFYASWSPTVRELLSLVDEEQIPEWTLRIHSPLDSWVEGAVALMGDACHPTLPYVSQGAAQAVEDAAVIAAVLALTTQKEDSAPSSRSIPAQLALMRAQSTSRCSYTRKSARRARRQLSRARRRPRAACICLTGPRSARATPRSRARAVASARTQTCGETVPSRAGSGASISSRCAMHGARRQVADVVYSKPWTAIRILCWRRSRKRRCASVPRRWDEMR
jgi:2-polyprenyl-6-methoxyphenol hydroxylase-like FAD-dependent oxidoreductase